jgi:hypothetical protein
MQGRNLLLLHNEQPVEPSAGRDCGPAVASTGACQPATEGFGKTDALAPSLGPSTLKKDEQHWLIQYQKNEIRCLASRTEELERQLRRRTIVLSCALVASVGATAGLVLFSLPQLARPPAQIVAPLPAPAMATPQPIPSAEAPRAGLPVLPPPTAGSPEQPTMAAMRREALPPVPAKPASAAAEVASLPEPGAREEEIVPVAPSTVLMAKPPPTIAPPLAAPNVANLRDALATIRQRLRARFTTSNPFPLQTATEDDRVD